MEETPLKFWGYVAKADGCVYLKPVPPEPDMEALAKSHDYLYVHPVFECKTREEGINVVWKGFVAMQRLQA